jgi:two-component system, NarL family, sensor histidine kinase BarA
MDPSVSADAAPEAVLNGVVQRERVLFEEILVQHANLHGVALKLLDERGHRLIEVSGETALCQLVYEIPACRRACRVIVQRVRREVPELLALSTHRCFSGAEYRVAPVHHEGRVVGKLVLGPFLPPTVEALPERFANMDSAVDPARAWERTARFTRVEPDRAEQIAQTIANVVEVLLFLSIKSGLTTDMHVASIREAYAEIAEKHQALEATASALHRADRRRTDVLVTLGRRLSRPLTHLVAHAEMLARGVLGELTEDQRAFVDAIVESSESVLRVGRSLEELAEIEQGELVLAPALADVEAVLAEVVQRAQKEAGARGIELLVRGSDAGLPPVWLDAPRVTRALGHLLDNALAFTPAGGRVELSARLRLTPSPGGRPEQRLALEVRDDGPGFPPEHGDRVFDAFYTVEGGDESRTGLGLGLTLASAVAQAHGGALRIDTTLEHHGGHVVMDLPLGLSGSV